MPISNTTIRLRKSATPGNQPSSLANGEIAINYADGRIYYLNANGSIASISGGGSSSYSFSTINVNSSLVLATSPTDILTLAGANGITVTACTSSKVITIGTTGTVGIDTYARDTANGAASLAQAAFDKANTGGSGSSSGYLANSIIFANASGYLSNTNNLQFFTSNNNFVVTGNVIGGGVRTTSSASAPASPTPGDIWYKTTNDKIYRYTFDGTNSYWIDINTPIFASNGTISIDSWARDTANVIIGVDLTQNTNITYATGLAQAAFDKANTGVSTSTDDYARTLANTATNNIVILQGVDTTQNTRISSVDNTANAAYAKANAAFDKANTGGSGSSSGYLANSVIFANTTGYLTNTSALQFFTSNNNFVVTGNVIGGGVRSTTSPTAPDSPTPGDIWYKTTNDKLYRYTYDGTGSYWIDVNTPAFAANGVVSIDSYARDTSNSAQANTIYSQGVDTTQNTRISVLEGGLISANSNTVYLNSLITTNNTRISVLEGGLISANANSAYLQGALNTANTNINTKFNSSGGTISGSVTISGSNDLIVTGNLIITGNISSQNVEQLAVADPLLVLGLGNYVSDTKDIGFASHYNDGANAHTGLIRDSGSKEYHFFTGYTPEVDASNNIDINHVSYSGANVNANFFKGNLIATTAVVGGVNLLDVNTSQNNRMSVIEGGLISANANTVFLNSLISTNNTRISSTDNTATAAYDKANAAFDKANTGGSGGSSSGYLANSVIIANTTGYLTNTSSIQYFTSNNNLVLTGNIIAGGVRSTASSNPPNSPTVGDIWYDTLSDVIYRYTYDGSSNYWIDIISPTVTSNAITSTANSGPKITSVVIANSAYISTGAYAVALAGGYILVNGSGFESVPQVTIGTQPATTIGFVSSSQLQVQVPAQSGGTYPIYVTNSDGSVAINVPGLTYNQSPVWSTGSTLTSGVQGVAISIQLAATDDGSVTYAVSSGSSLPSGLSLSSGGLLSGTVTGLSVNTTYNFSINAIDSYTQLVTQAFSITISVGDTYFPYTTLLLNGDGTANSNNNIIVDSSNNAFTVTRSGTPTQGTFTPFPTTGTWSNYFNGSTDYFSVPNNSNFNFGTGNFTVETWLYITAYNTGNYEPVFNNAYLFYISENGQVLLFDGSTNVVTGSAGDVPLNSWNHVAWVRSGTTITIYVNGISKASATVSSSIGSGSPNLIGKYSTVYFPGYMSNLRIINGTALYTSTFTPSTTPLSVVANTVLLTCQANRFIDSNTTPATITVAGTPSVQRFNPFGANLISYSTSTNSGSIYFNGSSDFLSSPSSSATNFSGVDWTIELWFYPTSVPSANVTNLIQSGQGTNNWQPYIGIGVNINRTLQIVINASSAATTQTFNLNSWNHGALVRSGGVVKFYLNGVATSILTTSDISNTNLSWFFGKVDNADGGGGYLYYFNGYLSNIRFVKGTALYTSAFTPSTTPLTPVANTSLLLSGNNAGIIDSTMQNNLVTVGSAQISTSTVKYGSGGIKFNGTTDYIYVPGSTSSFTISTSSFTIEMWAYWNNVTAESELIDFRPSGTQGAYPMIYVQNGNIFYWVNTNQQITGTSAVTTGQWYHIAVARSGSSTKMFVNGTQVGSTYTDNNNYLVGTNRPIIGLNGFSQTVYFNGYIDDLRVTRGVARYTANFTPPTIALPPL